MTDRSTDRRHDAAPPTRQLTIRGRSSALPHSLPRSGTPDPGHRRAALGEAVRARSASSELRETGRGRSLSSTPRPPSHRDSSCSPAHSWIHEPSHRPKPPTHQHPEQPLDPATTPATLSTETSSRTSNDSKTDARMLPIDRFSSDVNGGSPWPVKSPECARSVGVRSPSR